MEQLALKIVALAAGIVSLLKALVELAKLWFEHRVKKPEAAYRKEDGEIKAAGTKIRSGDIRRKS